MNITITGMSLDGHSVQVPAGLSDLLNSSGAWVKGRREPEVLNQYNRQVVSRDGNLVTILTKKEAG